MHRLRPLPIVGFLLLPTAAFAQFAPGASPQASVITNVDVNVDTRVEIGGAEAAAPSKAGENAQGNRSADAVKKLSEMVRADSDNAPIRVVTNVTINVSTTLRLPSLDRRSEMPASPKQSAKKKKDKSAASRVPDDSPDPSAAATSSMSSGAGASHSGETTPPVQSDVGVTLGLSRLAIGETVELELQGKFEDERQAAETADRLNQEKLKWMGRALMLPVLLKSQPETARSIGKLLSGFEAKASGETLTISVSVPAEVTSAIRRAITAE